MDKIKIGGVVDRELWLQFRIAVIRKYGTGRGTLMRALEEAIRLWVEKNKV